MNRKSIVLSLLGLLSVFHLTVSGHEYDELPAFQDLHREVRDLEVRTTQLLGAARAQNRFFTQFQILVNDASIAKNSACQLHKLVIHRARWQDIHLELDRVKQTIDRAKRDLFTIHGESPFVPGTSAMRRVPNGHDIDEIMTIIREIELILDRADSALHGLDEVGYRSSPPISSYRGMRAPAYDPYGPTYAAEPTYRSTGSYGSSSGASGYNFGSYEPTYSPPVPTYRVVPVPVPVPVYPYSEYGDSRIIVTRRPAPHYPSRWR